MDVSASPMRTSEPTPEPDRGVAGPYSSTDVMPELRNLLSTTDVPAPTLPARVGPCTRCGHEWKPLVASPRNCPQCHSSYWDRARTHPPSDRAKSIITRSDPRWKDERRRLANESRLARALLRYQEQYGEAAFISLLDRRILTRAMRSRLSDLWLMLLEREKSKDKDSIPIVVMPGEDLAKRLMPITAPPKRVIRKQPEWVIPPPPGFEDKQ